jgi:hypothetical protein
MMADLSENPSGILGDLDLAWPGQGYVAKEKGLDRGCLEQMPEDACGEDTQR